MKKLLAACLLSIVMGTGAFAQVNNGVTQFVNIKGKLLASQVPAFTGDFACSGLACALSTVNSNVGTFGSAATAVQLTVDAKGRVTGVVTLSITAPAGALTGDTINSTVLHSSLQDFGANAAVNNIAANSLSLSKIVQAPSKTLRGNPTGSTATVTDAPLSSHMDAAFGNTQGSIIVRTSTGWNLLTPSLIGQAVVFNGTDTVYGALRTLTPQGRLTLTSGAPILTTNTLAAATIYYTPYIGNSVPLWNGTGFYNASFSEMSQALSDTTKSPSAAAAGQVYDMFVWTDAGTLRVTRGPAWSAGATAGSNTARGSGVGSTALTRVNGMLVNQVAITNGPAAGYGTYVGTIATDAGGATVSFTTGGAGVGGTAAMVGMWNAFNRVNVGGLVRDTTSSWTYSTASTWRAANGSSTIRVTFVSGQPEDVWLATYSAFQSSSASGYTTTGVGVDSTTAFAGTTGHVPGSSTTSVSGAQAQAFGLIGQHYLSALEYASAGTLTAYGTNGVPASVQTGLIWTGRY